MKHLRNGRKQFEIFTKGKKFSIKAMNKRLRHTAECQHEAWLRCLIIICYCHGIYSYQIYEGWQLMCN